MFFCWGSPASLPPHRHDTHDTHTHTPTPPTHPPHTNPHTHLHPPTHPPSSFIQNACLRTNEKHSTVRFINWKLVVRAFASQSVEHLICHLSVILRKRNFEEMKSTGHKKLQFWKMGNNLKCCTVSKWRPFRVISILAKFWKYHNPKWIFKKEKLFKPETKFFTRQSG